MNELEALIESISACGSASVFVNITADVKGLDLSVIADETNFDILSIRDIPDFSGEIKCEDDCLTLHEHVGGDDRACC